MQRPPRRGRPRKTHNFETSPLLPTFSLSSSLYTYRSPSSSLISANVCVPQARNPDHVTVAASASVAKTPTMRAGAASTPVCSWRFILYSILTFGLTFAVVQHAISTREAYYAVVVYLVTSKFSLLVLSNCALVVVAQLVLFFQYLFLGRLEPREAEVRAARPALRRPPPYPKNGGHAPRKTTPAPPLTPTAAPPRAPHPPPRSARLTRCAAPRLRCASR